MANVTFNITSDNYTTAQTLTVNIGDTLNINYERIKGTAVTSYYAVMTSVAPNIPGCVYGTFDTSSYNNYIKGNITGTPTTAGTYVLKMGRFRPAATTKLVDGEYITVNVIGTTKDYYSNLYYNANTGTGAPADDKSKVTASTTPAIRFTIIPDITPTLDNYEFLGWSQTKYPVDPSIVGSAEYPIGSAVSIPYLETDTGITLYAVWKYNPPKEKVIGAYIGNTKVSVNNINKKITIK